MAFSAFLKVMKMKRVLSNRKNGQGTVTIDYPKLHEELIQRSLSETQFCLDSGVSPKTMANVRKGLGIRPSSLGAIASFLKLAPGDLLARGRPGNPEQGWLPEWDLVEALGDWQKASNGLEFRIWKLKHQSLAETWGRGKCYRVQRLPTRDQKRVREFFLRHASVCRKFRGQPHIPINLSVFPAQDGKTWWAVDEWVEGHSLEQILKLGPLLTDNLPRVMRQIATGLRALHEAVIVRRDLSPRNILIRNSDHAVMLTDFEMSKLFDGSPTVKVNGEWLEDPYQAPEVYSSSTVPDVRADLFSWGRIFVHAATGQLLDFSCENALLERITLPGQVREIVKRCLALPQEDRPKNIDAVLNALQGW